MCSDVFVSCASKLQNLSLNQQSDLKNGTTLPQEEKHAIFCYCKKKL